MNRTGPGTKHWMKSTPTPHHSQTQFDTFNREINEFYESLKASNFTDEEIRRILSPIKTGDATPISKIVLYAMAALTALVLIPAIYDCFIENFADQLDWHFSSWGRTALITILPFWDWTYLKNEQCLVGPWQPAVQMNGFSFNCELCENLDRIDVYGNPIDDNKLKMRYLDVHTPVVFDGSFWKWPDNLLDQILKNKEITTSYPCNLATNMHDGQTTVGSVLQKAEIFDEFFLHFQNCELQAMKHFRSHTPRPPFLPVTLHPVQYNWLLWSKDYNVSSFKRIELVEKIGVFVQVKGRNYVKLIPRGGCDCPIIDLGLNKGEALLFTSLWDLEYRPEEKGENLAVVLETH